MEEVVLVTQRRAHDGAASSRSDERGAVNLPPVGKPVIVETDAYSKDGWTVPLPRDRSLGTGLNAAPEFPPEKALLSWLSTTPRENYERFLAHPLRKSALDVLGKYVARTVPTPVHAQGLWVLTAFSYDYTLFRVNAGQTEVLNADEELSGVTRIFVSAEQPDFEQQFAQLQAELAVSLDDDFPYNIKEQIPVRRITCPDLKTARDVLDRDFVLEGAYWLICALIRGEGSQARRYHNLAFAASVLTKAWEISEADRSSNRVV
jgi:hypothetical protein